MRTLPACILQSCLILSQMIVNQDVEPIVSEEVHHPAEPLISAAAWQVIVAGVRGPSVWGRGQIWRAVSRLSPSPRWHDSIGHVYVGRGFPLTAPIPGWQVMKILEAEKPKRQTLVELVAYRSQILSACSQHYADVAIRAEAMSVFLFCWCALAVLAGSVAAQTLNASFSPWEVMGPVRLLCSVLDCASASATANAVIGVAGQYQGDRLCRIDIRNRRAGLRVSPVQRLRFEEHRVACWSSD